MEIEKHGLRIAHVEFVLLVLIDSKGWPGLQRPGLGLAGEFSSLKRGPEKLLRAIWMN
jgi:hypothetical protein